MYIYIETTHKITWHFYRNEKKKKKRTQNNERVTGRKARDLQMEEIGYKWQSLFISPLRGRRKHTTSVRFFSLKILCCQDDTRFHLNLTSLKPWANQYIFVMEMFFLSYVNETMYLLWSLPFFKMVPLKTNFWLITAQQTNIHINCFMAGGWHTLSHTISKMHVVVEGLVKLPQPQGVSLICLISF